MKFHQVYFVLDPEFRLLWIGGEWDEFALANSAERARSNEVLATSLMVHIADDETRTVTRDIIETVMEVQSPFRMDYRCDSPTMMRRFHMTVQPMKDHRVLVVHDLRDAETFKLPLTPWRHDQDAPDAKCTFCHSVQFGDGPWVPVEVLSADHPERVRFTVCKDCEQSIRDNLRALRAQDTIGQKPSGGFGPKEDSKG